MLELIKYIVEQFADKKDEIEYLVEEDGDDHVIVTIVLAEEDMGRVIGRQGRLAKALRVIVHSASIKEGKRYSIEIKDKGEIK